MIIGGDTEWWADFHEDLRDGRYDEEVIEFLRSCRPDLLEDLRVNVVLECWGENDELHDNKLVVGLVDAALTAAPTTMLEFFGDDDKWRELWWKHAYNDQR